MFVSRTVPTLNRQPVTLPAVIGQPVTRSRSVGELLQPERIRYLQAVINKTSINT